MIVILRRRVGINVRVDVRESVEIVIVWSKGRSTVIIGLFCVECTAVILKGPRLMQRRFRVVNLRRLYFQASVNQGYSNQAHISRKTKSRDEGDSESKLSINPWPAYRLVNQTQSLSLLLLPPPNLALRPTQIECQGGQQTILCSK